MANHLETILGIGGPLVSDRHQAERFGHSLNGNENDKVIPLNPSTGIGVKTEIGLGCTVFDKRVVGPIANCGTVTVVMLIPFPADI